MEFTSSSPLASSHDGKDQQGKKVFRGPPYIYEQGFLLYDIIGNDYSWIPINRGVYKGINFSSGTRTAYSTGTVSSTSLPGPVQ